MSGRPLILLDVDGVINVSAPAAERAIMCRSRGWRQPKVNVDGILYRVFHNPAIGPMILGLAEETGGELAWATMWEDHANRCIAPLLGLPQLPVGPARKHPYSKARGIIPWTQERPFVWFDDELDEVWGMDNYAQGQPHLGVLVDERTGLTEEHVAKARAWLLGLDV